MALVDVDKKWVSELAGEMDTLEIYYALVGIIHGMMDDDQYTIERCFNDLLSLATRIRGNIDETKFSLDGLRAGGDGPDLLTLVKSAE